MNLSDSATMAISRSMLPLFFTVFYLVSENGFSRDLTDLVGTNRYCKVYATGAGACDYENFEQCQKEAAVSGDYCIERTKEDVSDKWFLMKDDGSCVAATELDVPNSLLKAHPGCKIGLKENSDGMMLIDCTKSPLKIIFMYSRNMGDCLSFSDSLKKDSLKASLDRSLGKGPGWLFNGADKTCLRAKDSLAYNRVLVDYPKCKPGNDSELIMGAHVLDCRTSAQKTSFMYFDSLKMCKKAGVYLRSIGF